MRLRQQGSHDPELLRQLAMVRMHSELCVSKHSESWECTCFVISSASHLRQDLCMLAES